MPQVHIVTDNTADLPRDEAAKLGITIIPLRVVFGTEIFKPGVDLTNDEFYRRLVAAPKLPTTSQPPPGEFEQVYRSLLDTAPDSQIIGIFLSGELSGTVNTARTVAEQVDPNRIHVLDSKNATMAYGLVVLAAARAAQEGKPVDEILAMVQSMLDRAHLLAMINTLTYLVKGGRVSRVKGMLGGLLSVKPIIAVRNGQIVQLEQPRTQNRAVQRIIDLTKEAAPLEELAILHTNDPALATQVRDALTSVFPPGKQVSIVEAGPVIGTHTGPSCVGTAFITAERK